MNVRTFGCRMILFMSLVLWACVGREHGSVHAPSGARSSGSDEATVQPLRDSSLYTEYPFYGRYVMLEPIIQEYLLLAERQDELMQNVPFVELAEPPSKPECEDPRNTLIFLVFEETILQIEALRSSARCGISILRSLSGQPIGKKDILGFLDAYTEDIRALRRQKKKIDVQRKVLSACQAANGISVSVYERSSEVR